MHMGVHPMEQQPGSILAADLLTQAGAPILGAKGLTSFGEEMPRRVMIQRWRETGVTPVSAGFTASWLPMLDRRGFVRYLSRPSEYSLATP